MRKKLHLSLNTIFLTICLLLLVASFIFPNQGYVQTEIIAAATLIYVGYALLHHHLDKTLTIETTLEYILIASLVLVILGGSSIFK